MIVCRKKKKSQQSITIRGTDQLKTMGGGKQGGEALLTTPVTQGMTAAVVSAGPDNLPAYVDCDSIKKSLLCENQNSIMQAHLNQLKGQVSTTHIIWGGMNLHLRQQLLH